MKTALNRLSKDKEDFSKLENISLGTEKQEKKQTEKIKTEYPRTVGQ